MTSAAARAVAALRRDNAFTSGATPQQAPAGAPEPAPPPQTRRGPFRPAELTPVRMRVEARTVAVLVRLTDLAVVVALSTLFVNAAMSAGLMGSPVRTVLPYAAAALLLLLLLGQTGAYKFAAHEPLSVHLLRVMGAGLLGAFIVGAAVLLTPATARFSALMLCQATLITALYVLHAGWWLMVRRMRRRGRLTPNIVVVGATATAERLIETALRTREVNILGVFDDRAARAPQQLSGVPVLGPSDALLEHRIVPFVDQIVITVTARAQSRVRQLIERLRVLPTEIVLYLDGDDIRGDALQRVADAPLSSVSGLSRNARRAISKRAQDLLLGGLALLLLAPVMLAVAVAVKCDSPGPVFFRQRRHGFNNEAITVWKFRSMRVEATDATASRQVTRQDPRVTRVGRFIRKTSLDELPQIFNVLKGEMSLVGPRPHAIGMKTGEVESERLVAEYAHRHRMKPGVTGWAAIHGSRGPVDTPEAVQRRVALDVEYIQRQSLWLDLYIMVMTLPRLLGDGDAAR